ncbi:MAG: arsenate reductase ArsC [Betaproteobacteria bacterium]|nr:arsenate reductase ArsC [Betaproteobacteria bacterium]
MKPHHLLFLCTGNSARSILAEAYLNSVGRGLYTAHSAGSHPAGRVHAQAIDLLKQRGIATTALRSKSWDEFVRPGAPQFDFIFTVCDNAAGETCPVWPGQPLSAHWGIADPAAATGTDEDRRRAFARAFDELSMRIDLFLNLPIGQLDRHALKKRLDQIGSAARKGEKR